MLRDGNGRSVTRHPRRDWKCGHAPLPHTPVTRLSAAHSGSARPTPTDDANGPVGILRSSLSAPAPVRAWTALPISRHLSPLGVPPYFGRLHHGVHRPSFSLNRTHDETVRPRPDQLFHLVAQKRRCSEDTFPRAHHTEKAPRQTRLRRTRLKCSRYRPVPHLALVSRRRERAFVPDTSAAAPVSRSGASMENEQRTMMTSWPRRRTSTSRLRRASTSRLRWRC